MTPPDEDVGFLCTDSTVCEEFMRRYYDPDADSLDLPRHEVFWNAVSVATERGERGQNTRVAIIDQGFDLSSPRLAQACSPLSRLSDVPVAGGLGSHGTVVAMLVNAVAPEAELVLVDVRYIRRQYVAEAVQYVSGLDVDVLNLSLAFRTPVVPFLPTIDIEALTDVEHNPDGFLEVVRTYAERPEPYASDGCPECVLCDALRALPPGVLVVAAAGNLDQPSCPACLNRTVGVGFASVGTVQQGNQTLVTSGLPEEFDQNLTAETLIPQPPGFLGTSFAAPLLCGLAALTHDRRDFGEMARLPMAFTPFLMLAMSASSQGISRVFGDALVSSGGILAESVPARHQHWKEKHPDQCVACSLFVHSFYQTYSAVLIGLGAEQAAGWTYVSMRVIPWSADLAGNRGTLLRRLAQGEADQRAKVAKLDDAAQFYRFSLALRPGDPTFEQQLAEVSLEIEGLQRADP